MIRPMSPLVRDVCQRIPAISSRQASIYSALKSIPVLVSTNKDVHTNLALEHWIYSHTKFSNKELQSSNAPNATQDEVFSKPIVLIWINSPSIVIGRHQNPWTETTLGLVNKLGIKLARRHSGGGCVYHDDGNINITVIGHRSLFENRQANLRFLADFLKQNYNINCEPNMRHDLVHSETGLKISGSAAKLGRSNCYHHFTLLIDADKEIMRAVIRQNQQDFITTNSSLSTRSSVINLKELQPDITPDQVVSDLSQAYGRYYSNLKKIDTTSESLSSGEEDLEALKSIQQELTSPAWIYGMTPKFKMEQHIDFIDGGVKKTGKLVVQVNRGKIDMIDISGDVGDANLTAKFLPLIGTDFTFKDTIINTVKMFGLGETSTQGSRPNASEQIFAMLLLKMVREAHF